MSIVRPFKALRPSPELVFKVSALPYDVMNAAEAKQMAAGNPYSFLHISHAEMDLPENTNLYDESVYAKAAENFHKLIAENVLQKETTDCFYIYSLTMNGRTQTGLVACCSIEDYFNDIIKKHEFTRPEKEEDRIRHMSALQAHTGPIFLAYRDNVSVNKIIEQFQSEVPIFSFVAEDGIKHEGWKIEQPTAIKTIVQLFENQIRYTYIADGHHRAASAAKTSARLKEANPNHTGYEDYNYFLSVLFPASQLAILDYNRVVKDLNGLSEAEFLNKVAQCFSIQKGNYNTENIKPIALHQFAMYLGGKWYRLEAKPEIISNDPIGILDVTILQNYLLQPVLGIEDPRTDKRIDFIGGIRGLKELEKRVNSGEMKVAFALYPVSLEQLMAIADTGNVMPPKSTWFEPKLRDGLFSHQF